MGMAGDDLQDALRAERSIRYIEMIEEIEKIEAELAMADFAAIQVIL
jgi:hypothetical protein